MARPASLAARAAPGHPSSTALRALRVLEEVGASPAPLSVTEVAQRVGIDRPVAYRMLVTLFGAGYLLRDASGRHYRLSRKLVSLSRHLLVESRRTELVRECLDDLSAQTLESVHYSLLEGMETVLVQRAKGRQVVSVNFEIGERSGLHYTAIGKAVLAFQDSAFIDRVIAAGLPRRAARTITSSDALRAECGRIRTQGYAYDDFEFAEDMRCVAVPVFEPGGKVESGISISGPIPRFDHAKLDSLRDRMLVAAKKLSERLSGS
jgi:IclR family transcriptional regulator, KDG regulon repressor